MKPFLKEHGKAIAIGLAVLVAAILGLAQYKKYLAPTRIAFVNYPEFQLARIKKANDSRFIRVEILETDDLANARNYTAVFLFGRGFNLKPEQVETLKNSGVSLYMEGATNPDIDVTNLEGPDLDYITEYFKYGGSRNYKNLLSYVRENLDGKTFFTEKYKKPRPIPPDVFFHLDEAVLFEDPAAFEKYGTEKGFLQPGAPKVVLLTTVPGPFNANREHLEAIIGSLSRRGLNVYPIASVNKRLAWLKQIRPDVAIMMPHGRLAQGEAEEAQQWLRENKVPLLAPLSVFTEYDKWVKDPQGMKGALLTMSVTLPELDGAINPYAIVAQYRDENNFLSFRAIPERLEAFSEMVEKYITLKKKSNADKKIAIYYFKGPGLNAMVAANMEVVPSLFHVLKRLQAEGYNLQGLPATEKELWRLILQNGSVLAPYAEGSISEYIRTANPELVEAATYESWAVTHLEKDLWKRVEEKYGKAPGSYLSLSKEGKDYIAVSRIQFGNVVLLPQPLPGIGDNTNSLVHGAKEAPPHPYIASYLWTRNAFKADAILHFGTHGSLEFTPGKQIALSSFDWTDALIGNTPHFYVYTISNVGEAMIAKRRSYATTLSYLTPPLMEGGVYDELGALEQQLHKFAALEEKTLQQAYAKTISERARKLSLYKDLGLQDEAKDLTVEQCRQLANLVEEIANEKVTGGLYTLGNAYTGEQLNNTVMLMARDPLAWSLARLDVLKGHIPAAKLDDKVWFNKVYTGKARQIIARALNGTLTPEQVIADSDRKRAQQWKEANAVQPPGRPVAGTGLAYKSNAAPDPGRKEAGTGRPSGRSVAGAGPAHKSNTAPPGTGKKEASTTRSSGRPVPGAGPMHRSNAAPDPREKEFANAVMTIETAITHIRSYRQALQNSTETEFTAILTALSGGYISPSPGGDPVATPAAIPTGRNLFSIDAEKTPSAEGWEIGKMLGNSLLENHLKTHGTYPKKVAFTLWPGDFIQTEGAMLGQVFWLLGVEPLRDPFGRVQDIRLIPEAELKRPRIDVVVQTSGQLRDLAASRLKLINAAVKLASEANDKDGNFVRSGILTAEKMMIAKGISPREARELAALRVFGGANGSYGTGIMGMVEKGDSWTADSEVGKTYLNNMGAVYDDSDRWAYYKEGVFEAALQNTEAIVQPRESNTWGALSLDHVYEFAGGLNLAVKTATGKEAEVFFNDFRNPSNARIQNIKEAIWVEARSTLLNPRYINELAKGSASAAEKLAETFRNTYGWNVMKPGAVDNALWNQLHEVYVKDVNNLGIRSFFERENPFALEEMTAVMLETIRKGYWKASDEQIREITGLHLEQVREHGAGCSGFVCNNTALRSFIADRLSGTDKTGYNRAIDAAVTAKAGPADPSITLKKTEEPRTAKPQSAISENSGPWYWLALILLLVAGLFWFIRNRKRS